MCVCVCVGGTSRASGMLLHYKPMGSQDAQQLQMEAAEDKKVASLWLAAMHKVQETSHWIWNYYLSATSASVRSLKYTNSSTSWSNMEKQL